MFSPFVWRNPKFQTHCFYSLPLSGAHHSLKHNISVLSLCLAHTTNLNPLFLFSPIVWHTPQPEKTLFLFSPIVWRKPQTETHYFSSLPLSGEHHSLKNTIPVLSLCLPHTRA